MSTLLFVLATVLVVNGVLVLLALLGAVSLVDTSFDLEDELNRTEGASARFAPAHRAAAISQTGGEKVPADRRSVAPAA